MHAISALRSFFSSLLLIGAALFCANPSLASSGTATAGQSVTFSVTVNGTAPFSYQWYKNGVSLTGAVNATCTLSSVGTGDAGTYCVIVANSAGSTTSDNAVLTVSGAVVAPSITTQPVGVTVTAGQAASFSVAAGGSAPLSYQWLKNGVNILGCNSVSYTISTTASTDAGSYSVIVSNSAGSATSSGATLVVNQPVIAPAITTQPVALTVTAGQSASFAVVASGTAPLSYQWRRNGVNIPGATNSTYTIGGTTTPNAGSYSVVVSNVVGSVTSNAVALTLTVAPAITSQPAATTVTAGQAATFSVVASGTAPLSYQWRKEGVAISGATSATYAIGATTTASAGNYSVVVSNVAGSATSNNAVLTVNAAPSITTQPSAVIVTAGQSASFTVVANGTPSPTYQWLKNGVNILGANSASYTISATSSTDAGSYSVVVSNAAGSVTSNVVALTLTVAPAITTQPVAVTVTAGQPASFTVVASGTAPMTYQWTKDGTAIAGATTATYTIYTTASTDAGNYSVVVTNSAGAATSNAAALTVTGAKPAPSSLVEMVPVSYSARGQNSRYPISALFDGNAATKWMDGSGTTWVKVKVATPSVLEAYSLTSAPDYPARDPASWTLSGSNDGVNWTVIESRSGQAWSSRGLTRDFALDTPPAAFTQFRFDFTVASGSSTQLAEIELFKVETPGAEAPSSMVQLTPASYSARGQNGTKEGVAKLFDGNVTTKWLDFSGTTWVQVNLAAPASLVAYGLASANDYPQRDPAAWTLSGSNDGATWTVIETRTGQAWSSRYLTRDFVPAQTSAAYKSFRFEFTATSGSITQLAELDLFGY